MTILGIDFGIMHFLKIMHNSIFFYILPLKMHNSMHNWYPCAWNYAFLCNCVIPFQDCVIPCVIAGITHENSVCIIPCLRKHAMHNSIHNMLQLRIKSAKIHNSGSGVM